MASEPFDFLVARIDWIDIALEPALERFANHRAPGEIDVTLATLDDAHNHPADRHVFVKDRLAWLRLDEGLPEHEEGTPAAR